MTTELNITKALDFSIQQIFSESYWEDYFNFKEKLFDEKSKLVYYSSPTSSFVPAFLQKVIKGKE